MTKPADTLTAAADRYGDAHQRLNPWEGETPSPALSRATGEHAKAMVALHRAALAYATSTRLERCGAPVPADWQPSDEDRAYAVSKGFSDDVTATLAVALRGNPRLVVDPSSAWRALVLRAAGEALKRTKESVA